MFIIWRSLKWKMRATMSLTLNCAEKYNQPHVHFEIHTINNHIEYNAKINYENDGTKRLVSEDDEISYPFKVSFTYTSLWPVP